jgi:gamma-glutamyltranspeptidase/glutathione hydrolase
MVVARHPLAAEAGCEIIRRGGNAVDAAVAASFATSVVQPVASTLGGGGLLVCWTPRGGLAAIDYLYVAPRAAHPTMYALEADAAPGLFGWVGVRDRANEHGHRAVAVPGSVAGLAAAVEGHGRLSLAEVIAPALRLARAGYPMDWYGSLMQGIHLDLLQRFSTTARLFLRDGRYPYRPYSIDAADVHRQPELACLLEEIADDGPAAFYQGRAAELLAAEIAGGNGLIDRADLGRYRVREAPPRLVQYRDYKVAGTPWSMMIYSQFLKMLATFDLGCYRGANDPERLHLVIELLKRCWKDRVSHGGDPDFVDGPWEGLQSQAYAQALAGRFDPRRTGLAETALDPYDFQGTAGHNPISPGLTTREGNTVHISAADGDGGMASLTETILGNYGALISTETGVLLNNGMMAFAPVDSHPNRIQPGKRPSTNMGPLIILDGTGKPVIAFGASGGRKIVSAVLQILSLIADHGMTLQEAIAEPRLDVAGDSVLLDSRMPRELAVALSDKGHKVEFREETLASFEFGNPCGILRTDGELISGVNPFQMTTAVAL